MALLGRVSRTARNSTREFSRRRDSNLAHLKVSARREIKERHLQKRGRKIEMERYIKSIKKWLIGSPENTTLFRRFSTVYQSHAKFIFLWIIDMTHDGRRAILESPTIRLTSSQPGQCAMKSTRRSFGLYLKMRWRASEQTGRSTFICFNRETSNPTAVFSTLSKKLVHDHHLSNWTDCFRILTCMCVMIKEYLFIYVDINNLAPFYLIK